MNLCEWLDSIMSPPIKGLGRNFILASIIMLFMIILVLIQNDMV